MPIRVVAQRYELESEIGRGGMAVALHEEFDLPTFYVGLGEQPGELQYFDPGFYADALFEVNA